jgi:hypothetical protein
VIVAVAVTTIRLLIVTVVQVKLLLAGHVTELQLAEDQVIITTSQKAVLRVPLLLPLSLNCSCSNSCTLVLALFEVLTDLQVRLRVQARAGRKRSALGVVGSVGKGEHININMHTPEGERERDRE